MLPTIEFFDDEYEVPEGYIAVRTRAVRNAENFNLDFFPLDEMRKAARTYEGCGNVFVDHTYKLTKDNNQYEDGIDRSRSRGYVMAQRMEGDTQWLLIAISKEWPKLVDAILSGQVNGVSMGCDCTTWCPICDTEFVAGSPCECGACPTRVGDFIHGQKVHEVLKDIKYYEISIVFAPAECTALFEEIVA